VVEERCAPCLAVCALTQTTMTRSRLTSRQLLSPLSAILLKPYFSLCIQSVWRCQLPDGRTATDGTEFLYVGCMIRSDRLDFHRERGGVPRPPPSPTHPRQALINKMIRTFQHICVIRLRRLVHLTRFSNVYIYVRNIYSTCWTSLL